MQTTLTVSCEIFSKPYNSATKLSGRLVCPYMSALIITKRTIIIKMMMMMMMMMMMI